MLACEDKAELERQAQAWCDRLALFGLKLKVKKTEYLTTDVNEHGSIKINGTEISRVTSFKYLGSTVTSDGSLKLEVNARVSAAWSKWRLLTGVLCDKTIPEYLKSKVYRAVVRPVATYDAECWPVTKEIESRLSVMETKMLSWTAGLTRLDRVRNETIRRRFGVASIADKLREARLRWYVRLLAAMSDDELDEGPGPIPSSSHAYFDGEAVDVEHTVSGLLASLRLEEVRHQRTSDEDDEQLRVIHQKIHTVVLQDRDDARRRRLRRALPPSNCVREQIFYLRRLPQNSAPAPSYYPRLFGALDCIVKESFDEEYRKVAIILGLVESLAELLVLELHVFEFPPRNEHRSLRKLIANALTNLTYGHAISKRRLCFYSEFIPAVVRILSEAKNLAQVIRQVFARLSALPLVDVVVYMCGWVGKTAGWTGIRRR
ncbi:unnamed protein product [Heligmosomoides polygyrus]|uniref:Reverse transcriptase domain-containing protein n=1 Tax=Heligmosomoides polygyrus TaxID=6339 RepID=A0A183GIR5_HELPZ|nr:unnamed protein product [Heligmosomoides polygyrus]